MTNWLTTLWKRLEVWEKSGLSFIIGLGIIGPALWAIFNSVQGGRFGLNAAQMLITIIIGLIPYYFFIVTVVYLIAKRDVKKDFVILYLASIALFLGFVILHHVSRSASRFDYNLLLIPIVFGWGMYGWFIDERLRGDIAQIIGTISILASFATYLVLEIRRNKDAASVWAKRAIIFLLLALQLFATVSCMTDGSIF
ncbi:MAG: hypothetical protein ABIH41_06560 [Nanoarchaeota archaeon]